MASATPKASPHPAARSCRGAINLLSRSSLIVQTAMRPTGEVVRPVIVGFDVLSSNSINCRSRFTVDYDLFGLPSSFNRLNRLRVLRRFFALPAEPMAQGLRSCATVAGRFRNWKLVVSGPLSKRFFAVPPVENAPIYLSHDGFLSLPWPPEPAECRPDRPAPAQPLTLPFQTRTSPALTAQFPVPRSDGRPAP